MPLGRSAQLVVNPGAEAAVAAPWANFANVVIQSTAVHHEGTHCFATQNVGAFDHYQDIALASPAEQAAIDAGDRVVNYTAYGMTYQFAASTLTLWLHALDAGGAILQTWSRAMPEKADFGVFIVGALLPVGTRALRVRWTGNCTSGGDVWVDDLQLYTDDRAIAATKVGLYAVTGSPPTDLQLTKGNEYVVFGPGVPGTLTATKAVLYAVSAPAKLLLLTKAVVYVVSGPPAGCDEYDGLVAACMDRPLGNVFGECMARPDAAYGGPGERPGVTFRGDVPFPRCD